MFKKVFCLFTICVTLACNDSQEVDRMSYDDPPPAITEVMDNAPGAPGTIIVDGVKTNQFMLLWTADFKYVGFFNHKTRLAGYIDGEIVDGSDEDLSEHLEYMTVFLAQQRTKEIEHDGKFFTVWDNEVDWDASIGNNEGANTATRFIQREIEAQGLPINLDKRGSNWYASVEHIHASHNDEDRVHTLHTHKNGEHHKHGKRISLKITKGLHTAYPDLLVYETLGKKYTKDQQNDNVDITDVHK